MAIAGAWRASSVTPLEYAGATRWGTGINPVHSVPDSHKPTTTREPLGSTQWSGAAPEEIVGPVQWGYSVEDQQFYGGEDYRYLEDDHPNLGENEAGRADRDGRIMEVGSLPQAEGWPAWGPYNDDNPVDGFPVAGPPGGGEVRAHSDGAEVENARAIAVPTRGSTGGWLNKARGEVARPVVSDESQIFINTGGVQGQGLKSLDNTRALARGADNPRTAIQSRTAGMRVKQYAKSQGMGGSPGTPDMAPVTQGLPYRPFFFRQGAMPVLEEHTWNEMEGRTAVVRTVPPDSGEYATVPETSTDPGYGYSAEDGGWY